MTTVKFDPTKHLLGLPPANAQGPSAQLVIEITPHEQPGYFRYSFIVHGHTEIYTKRGVNTQYAEVALNSLLKQEGYNFSVESISWTPIEDPVLPALA